MQLICTWMTAALAATALLRAQHVTEPPDIVPPGVLAVEASPSAEPLMRFGVSKRVEVRFESGIGAKVLLLGEERLRPAVSVMASSRDKDVSIAWLKSLPRGVWAAGSVARRSHSLAFGRDMGGGFGLYGEVFRDSAIWGADIGVTRTLGKWVTIEAGIGRTGADGWFPMFKLSREFSIRPR